jgi:predicted transcriptional regulator
MSKLTPVSMNLSDETLKKIGDIASQLHSSNRTTAVRSAVDISETILNTISHGGKIILEEANGERYLMKIPGVG